MVTRLGQSCAVFVVLTLVSGQQTEDPIQILKEKLGSLKTNKVKVEVEEDSRSDFSSILQILKQNKKKVTRDGSIEDILSKKCSTNRCQEEKNQSVVDFLLQGDRKAQKETDEKNHRSKLKDLSAQLDSLKSSKVTVQDEGNDFSSVLHILNQNNKKVSRDGNIQEILLRTCSTIRCQEEKNKRVVDFLLKGERNTQEDNREQNNRRKLEDLSAQLDKLIPTEKIPPRRRLRGKFDREQSRSSARGKFNREQPRSSAVLGELPQLRGLGGRDLTSLLADGRNVYIFTLDGSENPRFLFEN